MQADAAIDRAVDDAPRLAHTPMKSGSTTRHSVKLPLQLVGLSLLFVVTVAAVSWTVVSRSQTQLIEFKSLKIAEIVAMQAASARSVYSNLAVSKLVDDGFGSSAYSEDLPGHIPLPAQFLKRLSRESTKNADGLYRFKPVSLWNLDAEQGIVDPFQQWAWKQLEKQDKAAPQEPLDWQPVWRIEEVAGATTLRYMRADPAASASCVNCHNALEQSPEIRKRREAAGVEPGHRWELNELLGAIQIEIPLERAAELAQEQSHSGLLLVVGATGIGLVSVCFLMLVHWSRSRAMTDELTRLARRDFLTGLPNRLDFDHVLNGMLESEFDNHRCLAVMILDLDGFKQINDTLGHEVGDTVLRITGARLQGALGPEDYVARLGGDEFAVLLPQTSVEQAQATAMRLSGALEKRIQVDQHQLDSGGSIGIALAPADGTDAPELLRCADVAMYVAKKAGQRFAMYDRNSDDNDISRLALINDLRDAVRQSSLSVYFQPKYSLIEQRMVGAEALLRWFHPMHGTVPPGVIVDTAEGCGFIEELTRYVLKSALAQCRLWRDAGFDLHVSVNLSAANLHESNLAEHVSEALAEAGVPAEALVLEVTESAMMKDTTRAEQVLGQIKRLGVTLSVDDFGTGYCSLSYLSKLPVQELKLDRSFVKNVVDSKRDAVIVKATLDLAHNLDLHMVAEGVEDAAALDYLHWIGCDVVQGYFLCRPVSADELTRRLPASYRFTPPQYKRAA